MDVLALGCGAAVGLVVGLMAFAWASTLTTNGLSVVRPAAAMAGCLACAGIACRYGLTPEAAEYFALSGVLICVTLTDLAELRIPNPCVLCAMAVRLAYLVAAAALGRLDLMSELGASCTGAVVIGVPLAVLVLVMDSVLGGSSMGGGDLKLFCVGGFYFGWQRALVLVFASCLLGLCFVFVRSVWARLRKEDGPGHAFAFGPAIACATWLVAICPVALTRVLNSIVF